MDTFPEPRNTDSSAGLLLLSDGRFPAGGYAHSSGLESAIRTGRVQNMGDLERFLTGRAMTTGAVNAAFAAASCATLSRSVSAHSEQTEDPEPDSQSDPESESEALRRLATLDRELDARTPSPALRRVSQTLGRQLLRALEAISPHPLQPQLPRKCNHPIAFGAGAAMLDLTPLEAARGLLHETVSGPASAVVKLMSADPFEAYRVIAGMRGLLDELAEQTAARAWDDPSQLPSFGAPVSDYLAEVHQRQGVRLFAS